MLSGRRLLSIAALGLATAGWGCFVAGDPLNPVGATKVDGEPTLAVSLCDGEGVTSVFVTDSNEQSGEGPLLWKIEATGRPIRLETFVLGDVPNGFRETHELSSDAVQREVTAWVLTDVELVGLVDFTEVEEGRIYIDLERSSRAALARGRSC
jgi:hypothetical protein